ncbi:MAG TPA: hypothetical protein VK501_24885 [Baekduia sp.]|uniref:hypothetical protein n=1 Tax=Baekduia sp. TaxID=2600305 RepID=UPI002BAAF639|nr:hypothetical protein [Baekduia sp.]HMJ37163.1 hypothetical protein [Baekduia sp.]
MDVLDLDPGTLLVAGVGAAVIGSPEVRRAVGRGVGWAAATVWRVTGPVVTPLVDAGRDVAGGVRDSAQHNGGRSSSQRSASSRPRRPTGASST